MREAIVCYPLRGEGRSVEILLGKRLPDLFCGGIWNGPGGKIEKGETILRCLRREPQEEVGIRVDVRSAELIASVDSYHPSPEGHTLEWRVHYLLVRKWQGEPRPIEEYSELRWFSIFDLPWSEMMKDHAAWLPMALHHSRADKLLSARIFYGNGQLSVIEKGEFEFIPMPRDILMKKR